LETKVLNCEKQIYSSSFERKERSEIEKRRRRRRVILLVLYNIISFRNGKIN